MSNAIKAGRAFVEVGVKNTLGKGLRGATRQLKAFGSSVSAIGAQLSAIGGLATAPLLAITKSFASEAAAVGKMAKQTGASVESLSALGYAATRSGADIDDLEGAMEELNLRMGETIQSGIGPAADAFRTLGLSAEKLNDMAPVDRFRAIADSIAGIQDETKRAFMADEIFGGDAFKILPMLNRGAAGIDDLMKKADKLGLVISGDDASAASAFNAAWKDARDAMDGAVKQLGVALAPALTTVVDKVTDAIATISEFIGKNKGLAVVAFKVGAAITAIGGTLIGAGMAITAIGTAIGAVTTILGVMGSVFMAVFSPIGAAVALAGLAIWHFRDRIMSLLEPLKSVWDFARDTFEGIANAIRAGDIELAMDILTLSLKQAWLTLQIEMKQVWADLQNYILSISSGTIKKVMSLWRSVSETISKWLADRFYDVALMASGEENFLTDAERNRTRDSAVSQYYDDIESSVNQVLDTEKKAHVEGLKSKLAALKQERRAALDNADEELKKAKELTDEKSGAPDARDFDIPSTARAAQLESVEFGVAAFKKFRSAQSGTDEKQLQHLKSIDQQLRRHGIVLSGAGE